MTLIYPTAILADAPQLYYRSGELSGTVATDMTANNYSGTYVGKCTLNQPGAIGRDLNTSVLLDGSSGYISVPAGATQGATGTWEGWFNLTNVSFATNPRLIANDNVGSSKKGIEIGINAGATAMFINIGYNSNNANVSYSHTFIVNTWYYFAFTYDGVTAIFYINGVNVAQSTVNQTLVAGGFSYNIGRDPAYSGDYVPGFMDEVAVYSTALSPARIAAHYNAATSFPNAMTASIGQSPVTIVAGSLKISNSVGRRSQAAMTIITDIYTFLLQYQQVGIWDKNNNLVFSGYVIQPRIQKPGFDSYLIQQVSCVDQHYLADKRVFYGTFTNRTAGVIVTAIFNQILAAEGVTVGQIFDGILPSPTLYPAPTLYPSGSGLIPQATFYYTNVAQALDLVAKQAGISGNPYYWMIDQNKKLWFVPYNTVVNSTVVDGTAIEQQNYQPTLTYGNPTYRNSQYIAGGVAQTSSRTETRQGDGKATTWTLNYDVSVAPTITLNGNSVSVGIQGTTNSQYYWGQGSKVITQDNSQTKLISTDTLSITYIGQYPNTAFQNNPQQIAYQAALDGSTGIVEEVTTDSTIYSAANALIEASALLNRYGNQGAQFQFTTKTAGYAPGQLITINYLPLNISNDNYLIESVDIEDKDGVNIWYTITAVSGAYDTNWVSFFSKLLGYNVPANSINAGSKLAYAAPLPAPALYPSPTLFPG